MSSKQSLSYTSDLVRQYDRARFLTGLFAPEKVRERLLTLYAFNVEIARIHETVSEPMIGQMRLQWWRDQLTEIFDGKGPSKGHPVAEPLAEIIERRSLSSEGFFKILAAREQDLADSPPAQMVDLIRYCEDTSAALAVLGLEVLGVSDAVSQGAAEKAATAWALVGIARSTRHRAQAGRVPMLPADAMHAVGLTSQDLQSPDKAAAASGIIRTLSDKAAGLLDEARQHRNTIDIKAIPVLLQATLASSYVKDLVRADYDIYDPREKTSSLPVAKLWWNAWRKRY